MAGKRVKAKGGILDKIVSAPKKAGEGLADYLLNGLYIKKSKTKAKSVKAK